MKAKSVGDQGRADQQQKAEREHHDGWIAMNEIRERTGRHQHGDDRDDHDGNMFGHADGGDDAVDRKHENQEDDLAHRGGKCAGLWRRGIGVFSWIDIVTDFRRRLEDEEEPAADQDQIAPGKALTGNGEQRRGANFRRSARLYNILVYNILARRPCRDPCRHARMGGSRPISTGSWI